jgi:two-component system, OmpR family, sensor histidine kinase KdpD
MIAAVVVGRLAALARQRAAEAEARAREAAVRERESALLAQVAGAILGERTIVRQLETIGQRVAAATGASRARVVAEPAPQPAAGELVLPLLAQGGHVWMYIADDTTWSRADLERLCEPLARLLDVAIERDRLAEVAAETEAARRADAARTAILHALSHDLRSPLTAITTAGSALRSAELSAADRTELLDVIDHEGARLAELMSDLLDLSKIQAGAVAPQADWCDLHEIVVAAADGLRTEHPIEFAMPTDLPLVRADGTQIARVFSNLIENAVKYSPPDAPVRITAGAGAGRVTVRVIDRGRGIPTADRAHVFEPFFRVRGTPGSGSGLGLAICKGFVEANGGQISMTSSPPTSGRGTSFAVSLPLVAQPTAAEAPR